MIINESAVVLRGISNYYGEAFAQEDEGKFYWFMQYDDDDIDPVEIPEYLYKSIRRFEDED